jgi:hypothetical protein
MEFTLFAWAGLGLQSPYLYLLQNWDYRYEPPGLDTGLLLTFNLFIYFPQVGLKL